MLALVLLIAAQPSPGDPTIHDAKRFAHYDHDYVKTRAQVARLFMSYARDLRGRGSSNTKDEQFERDYLRQAVPAARIYEALETVTDLKAHESRKVESLKRLKVLLGEEAFSRGEIPPPYPIKYEKEFKAWLNKKAETNPKWAKAIKDAMQREEEAKKKREQQKK